MEVRGSSKPAGYNFFDHPLDQFGEGDEEDWEDDDGNDDDDDEDSPPECRAQ